MVVRHEAMAARNRVVEDLTQRETAGIGVRALIGSSWGFQATPTLTAGRRPGRGGGGGRGGQGVGPGPGPAARPVAGARRGRPLDVDVGRAPARRREPGRQGRPAGGGHRRGQRRGRRRWPRPATRRGTPRSGSRPARAAASSQRIVECGAVVDATAIGDGETQRRSYPGVRGQYGTQGWELVRGLDLVANAARMAERGPGAADRAPPCPEGTTTAVLASDQVALQIHESVGPRRRARPHPRLGGGVRRHVLARPRPSWAACASAAS